MSFSIRLELPESLRGPVPNFGPTVHKHLRSVVDVAMAHMQFRTKYQNIREGFHITQAVTGNSCQIGVENSDPAALWREVDTSAHDIEEPAHWVPIDTLVKWLEAKGEVEPEQHALLLQRWLATHQYTVHHPGTTGDHIVEEEMQRAQPAAQEALLRAGAEILGIVGSKLGGGG